ncbi:MAG: nucleotidyltransferase domain-containing protein [Candidatus Asgardarchaeia archaeon]
MLLIYKDKIIKRIAEEYPPLDRWLDAIILYGSVARGDFSPNSDIDLLLITRNIKSTKRIFSEFRTDLFIDTGVIITAFYVTPDVYYSSKDPFFKTVRKEGKIIWEKQTK